MLHKKFDTDDREKINRFLYDMQLRGIQPFDAAPPIFRFLWSKNIAIPPPFFLSFWKSVLFFGAGWGILFSIPMTILAIIPLGILNPNKMSIYSLFILLSMFFIGGFIFGIWMGMYNAWRRKGLNLTSWELYGNLEK
jgi:hypothetical protein